MNRIGLYIVLLLLSVVMLLSFRVRYLKQEKTRLKDNQEALLSDVQYYKTSDSLNAAGINRLTLTNQEFKEYCEDLKNMVKSLNLKIRHLKSASRTATSAVYPVRAIVQDSIIPGRIDTIRCIHYRDNYLTLSGCMVENEFSGIVESRDTLIQIIHRIPKKFWFIRWGTKGVRQEVISKNPYSRIIYTEYIELSRK